MSLRPIDMTITVQHASEVSRPHTGDQTRPEIAQQQFADKLNRETQLQDQQVLQTNKAEEAKVDPDGRGSGGGHRGSGKKKDDKKKSQKPVSTTGGGMFDVSI